MTRHRIVQVLLVIGAFLAAPTLRAQCVPAVERLSADRKSDAARTQLEAQIKRAPDDDAAMHCLGRLLLDQNEPGDAVDWLEKAVAVNGKSAPYHLWLGIALRAEGQKAGVLRAPALVGRMRGHIGTGVVAEQEKDYAAAEKEFLSRVSNAHYFLGMAHEKSGHGDKAKAEYQAAIAENPKNEEAKKALHRCETTDEDGREQ